MMPVYVPPTCTISLATAVIVDEAARATIERVEQYAGASPGSAVVSYAANRAGRAIRNMGDRAKIKIAGATVFRGVVVHGPFKVNESEDEMQLILADDKWLMAGVRIGQQGKGTQGDPAGEEGFKDVGFNTVFNPEGKPNKLTGFLEFNTGSTAVYWTLRDILGWIFAYYVDAAVAAIDAAQVAHAAWDRVPSQVNLFGQTVPQAIDTLAQLAGESWALIPGDLVSAYRSIRPAVGTLRTIRMFPPRLGGTVAAVDQTYASDVDVALSIENCRDRVEVRSAPIVIERTYSKENGLLARVETFADKEYAARFATVVTAYSTVGLGANLTAGSNPKPWRKTLCTRLSAAGSGYVTAAEIAATPALAQNLPVEIPMWIALDGVWANRKLCVGGYKIDCDRGQVDFKASLDVMGSAGARETVAVTDWSTFGVWITVATVLTLPEIISTAAESSYLPDPMTEIVTRDDLMPESRYKTTLPKLDGTVSEVVTPAEDDEEKYVDIGARLQETLDSASAMMPAIESPIEATFEFFPIWYLGDRVQISGRTVGCTGSEVIISITYGCHNDYTTRIRATAVMAAVDPDQFIRGRR
jgi:hypothetical protein